MTASRYLIVNGDDFGQSHGVNRGIIEAHEHGIVTSASLMVRWPEAAQAAAYARAHSELSVGLHLDFGEWAFRNGEWTLLYSVLDPKDASAVEAEIHRQFDAFQNLVGRPPTHADSHQHVHRKEPVLTLLTAVTERLGIPLRDFSPAQYRGDFYGQTGTGEPWHDAIGVHALVKLLETLPAGITELGCHPGYAGDLDTMYSRERETEIVTLRDVRVRRAIEEYGITLQSFHEMASMAGR
jgi:predicted glycoside hydrolase/deacetylase ChbG (UPF0249 family)